MKISIANLLLLACLLGFGTWAVIALLVPRRVPDDFPRLPELQSQNAALSQLLNTADSAARANPYSAESMGKLGMAYHANQFYAQAERAYAIAARFSPNDYRWPYCEALLHEEKGETKEQIDALQKTIQLRPDYAPALQRLADFYFKQDKLEEAAAYYDRSLRAAGRSAAPQSLLGLARVAERRKDWRKVVEYLAPLTEEHPSLRAPYQVLGNAYEALGETGKLQQVQEDLLQPNLTIVPLVPDPIADQLLGLCCSSTRLLKEAGFVNRYGALEQTLRLARRAIEVEPNDADAHHFLARTLLDARGGDPQAVEEAMAQLREGLRLRPADISPLSYAAVVFFKNKKSEAAVEQLRTLLLAFPDKAEAHYFLGRVAERQRKPQEAIGQYQEALKLDPGHAQSYERLGLINVTEGRLDQAITCFKRALQLDPSLIQARCNLGVALEQQGKTSEAITEYRETIRRKPNDSLAHKFLAIVLARQGKVDEAADHFRQATRFAPNDAEAHYGLACALVGQGKVEEASREFKESLRLDPNYTEAAKQLQQLDSKKP